MKYYELRKNIEPKIVGVTDGAGQAYLSIDWLAKNDWYRKIFHKNDTWDENWWIKWACPTKYAQPLHNIIMHPKSKLTDCILSVTRRGFIVNDRLKNLLEAAAKLPHHQFVPAIFDRVGKIIDSYWWFVYDLDTGEHTVSFEKCKYDLSYHKQKFGSDYFVNINSYNDYIDVFNKTGIALPMTKVVFNKNFNKELDIFGLQFLSLKDIYISERLLNILTSENITGYRIHSKETQSLAELKTGKFCEFYFE